VRVRRAISHAIDRQELIEAVWGRGEVTRRWPVAWSSGRCPLTNSAGAKYYQYDPKEARRLLAEAGYPGLQNIADSHQWPRRDLIDDAQLVQRYSKTSVSRWS